MNYLEYLLIVVLFFCYFCSKLYQMKKITFINKLLILLFAVGAISSTHAQNKKSAPTAFGKKVNASNINPNNGFVRCVTTEYEKFLQDNDPKRLSDAQFEAWLAPIVAQYKSGNASYSQSGGIITIPVVVHVIHNGQPVGTAPNITDSQVESQITVMNNDYRRLANTPGFNSNPVGADVMIQFALAKVDPNGNPTNGINRVNLCQPSWSTAAIDSTVKPTTIWDASSYLNMWSVQFSDATLLGYAQFPSGFSLPPGLGGLGGGATTDGVVCNYATFGSINYNDGTFLLNAPYNEGRTMTHEVGHWLGLRHIWGDGDCTVDDFCADTPNAGEEHYGCEIGSDTCPEAGLDMVQNYMDYSDDSCMNIFTVDQKARMITVMNNGARRASLKTSVKDVAIPLFANDAELKLENVCATSNVSCSATPTKKVTIYNRGTSVLTSATINYNVNGGANNTYTWSGNLAPNKFATFDFPIIATAAGTVNMSIANANGVADQRATNNTVSGTFTMPTLAPNHAVTNVVFRLQRDRYASETAWTLKNSAGTTVYQSVAYTDSQNLPALITQNWTLPANDCYTFSITDSYGDGICCTYGVGFYDIKTTDGVVIAASPASTTSSFGAGESKLFTNNSLGRGDFAASNDIYVYPNPAKTNLNVAFPSELGLPDSYEIVNYLGQIVSSKKVATENDLSINTSALSSGVYLISVSKDSQKKTMRFIKE